MAIMKVHTHPLTATRLGGVTTVGGEIKIIVYSGKLRTVQYMTTQIRNAEQSKYTGAKLSTNFEAVLTASVTNP